MRIILKLDMLEDAVVDHHKGEVVLVTHGERLDPKGLEDWVEEQFPDHSNVAKDSIVMELAERAEKIGVAHFLTDQMTIR